MSLRESYRGTWKKGAYQCTLLKRAILDRWSILTVEAGKGATTSGEVEHQGEPAGAPDLYVKFRQTPICEIEVTGSDKCVPSVIWIGHHKVEYIRSLEDPSTYGLFLFYGRNNQIKYFMTGLNVLELVGLDQPKERIIRGITEHYYILPAVYFQGEAGFWEWIERCLNTREIY